MRRVARHLRQVRHAQHLVRLAQRRQLLAEHVPQPPADVGVDLVETTSVRTGSWAASTVFRASIVRDNSPPLATFRSGRAGSPGLAVSISSRWSIARGRHVAGHRVIGQGRHFQHRVELRLLHLQVGEVLLRLGRELLRHLRPAALSARRGLSQVCSRPT